MSTSLNVVSMAAWFCASLRRRAMVWRSRVMRTRSSRASSSGPAGARAGRGAWGASADLAETRCSASSTSPFSTWPRLPLPETSAAPTPFSSISLRADGAGGISLPDLAGSAGGFAGAACAAFGSCLRAPDFCFGCSGPAPIGAALPAAPSASVPRRAPTPTVSPSLTAIFSSRPAAGAGTSIVTLSVSSSTSGSSRATASPYFLNHWPTVASVTDSPRVGTLISSAIVVSCRCRSESRSGAESLFEEFPALLRVPRHQTGCGCRRCGAPGIAHLLVARLDHLENRGDARLHKSPGAHILRLFLAPDDLSAGEAAEEVAHGLQREGIELLDAQEIDVVDAAALPLLV